MQKIIIILITLVLFSALFIPGVMAQENKNEFIKAIPQVINGKVLTNEDQNTIEDLVCYFLNGEGMEIKNLDLSQLTTLESDESFEFSGIISYEVVNEGIESFSTSAEVYSFFDYVNSSVQLFSKSGNNYYEMNASVSNTGDFVVREISVVNGLVQKNLKAIPASSQPMPSQVSMDNLSTSISTISAGWVKVDCPSMWSSVPILVRVYNDVKLSDILTATGLAGLIAGYFSASIGTVITVGSVLAGALWTMASEADPANTYVDIFKIPFGTILSVLPGLLGTIAGSIYAEIDYYWIYE